MTDGVIDSLSVAFGALQAEVKSLLSNLTINRQEDLEHRREFRETMHAIGDRVGTLEHKVNDIYPVVQELEKKDLKKQTIKDYQTWLFGIAAASLSTGATALYTYFKSTGKAP